MFWFVRQFLLGVHILLATIWVGGILFTGWGVFPASYALTPQKRRLFLLTLMKKTHLPFTAAGMGVIATGIVLGTVLGPIRSLHDLWHTTYGHIWFTALITATFTLGWGAFIGYRKAMRTYFNRNIWDRAESGELIPLNKAIRSIFIWESVEVIGFMILIACMVSF